MRISNNFIELNQYITNLAEFFEFLLTDFMHVGIKGFIGVEKWLAM